MLSNLIVPNTESMEMYTFAHIIAESNQGSWSAWFRDKPQNVCGGDDWAHAVAILIDVHGSPKLDWHRIEPVGATTREGHAEFMIPYAKSWHYPVTKTTN